MRSTTKVTTTVSTKGQVILPKAIRDQRKWDVGTRLTVENTKDGVFGMLEYRGRPKTIEEMNAAIAARVKQRHARGRY
jgi:AbrB family looped-hinge helix DNA binding protein